MLDNVIMDGKFNIAVPLNLINEIYENNYFPEIQCVLLYGRDY